MVQQINVLLRRVGRARRSSSDTIVNRDFVQGVARSEAGFAVSPHCCLWGKTYLRRLFGQQVHSAGHNSNYAGSSGG